jgi:hypothetical protein
MIGPSSKRENIILHTGMKKREKRSFPGISSIFPRLPLRGMGGSLCIPWDVEGSACARHAATK